MTCHGALIVTALAMLAVLFCGAYAQYRFFKRHAEQSLQVNEEQA